jgi:folate-binding protein YgfZ
MPSVQLQDRSVIRVAGIDAQPLLHSILTTDINAMAMGEARGGALLTPQGKILFDFVIAQTGDGFLIDCQTTTAPDFLKRLTMYKLRAAVTLSLEADRTVSAQWDGPRAEGAFLDTRFGTHEVWRSHGSVGATDADDAWTALRIHNGVAELGADYDASDAFPHDVNLDQIGGLSFSKGCYVGQEVVSRMQHRGTARRRVLIATGATMITPRAPIEAAGKVIGETGSAIGTQALALVRIDRASEAMAAGETITANGVALTLATPPGARFAFPVAEPESA